MGLQQNLVFAEEIHRGLYYVSSVYHVSLAAGAKAASLSRTESIIRPDRSGIISSKKQIKSMQSDSERAA